MNAKIISFWFIVECPSCKKPQSINRWVSNGEIYELLGVKRHTCEYCDTEFTFEAKDHQTEKG